MPVTRKNSDSRAAGISTACRSRVVRSALRVSHRAFTLMELMVSVAILVMIILAVGVIFGGASRSVNSSQALMEMLANIRAVEGTVERQVMGMDKNAFLVIRSRIFDPTHAPNTPDWHLPYRFDQVSFISYGAFPNRTGADDSVAPFSDQTVANAAHVWIGQLVMESASPPDSSYVQSQQNFSYPGGLSQVPTGVYLNPNTGYPALRENECVLGIHNTLLLPGPANGTTIRPSGGPVAAYSTIRVDAAPIIAGAGESKGAHITASRFAVAALTPAQVMADIVSAGSLAGTYTNQADISWQFLCYRFKALASVYDTDLTAATDNPFVNGCFRMHPIAMQGVSSFKVEWTDGSFDQRLNAISNPNYGQQNWYSASPIAPLAGSPYSIRTYPFNSVTPDASVNQLDLSGANLNGDNYLAVFSPYNRNKWPKALRFTYHVLDPNNRLSGGRDFVQVVKIPD